LAAHDILAPTTWDSEEHDSPIWSEDDSSLTDREGNLQFLVEGEEEAESEDDCFSWNDFTSSDESSEEDDDDSLEGYPPAKRLRTWWDDDSDDDDDEDEAPVEGCGSSDEEPISSCAGGSDDEGSNGP
jgi:hypothetical protein